MNDTQAYWDGYKKAVKEESGGGGGLISHARVETGFQVYASGVGQDESWFPAPFADKKGRATAKKAAKTLANEHGCEYDWGLAIITPRSKTHKGGEPVTWSVDTMVRFAASYWSSHDIVLKSLKDHGVYADGKAAWLRLGFQDDPHAVETGKLDSRGKTPQFAYVTEKFANTKAARDAIKAMPKFDDEDNGMVGPYSREEWETYYDDIVEVLATLSETNSDGEMVPQTPAQIAKDYDVPVSEVEAFAKRAEGEEEIPL